jgi:hypothetical protein
MNAAKLIAWLVLPLVARVVLGMITVWAFQTQLVSFGFYLLLGALVAGGGVYLYHRAKRALSPSARARYRLDAAAKTYRRRNR